MSVHGVGGEWIKSNYGEPEHGTFTKEKNYLLISGDYCYAANFSIRKDNVLDLTAYSSLNAKVEVTGITTASHYNRNAGMSLITNSGAITDYTLRIRENAEDNLNQGVETFSIDLKNLTNKETYVGFDSNSYIIKIYEVWLEK